MYYENGNFSLYYEKYGDGKKKVIILPGWGDTRKTFNFIINNLGDCTTYIIDNPGFGNSITKEEDLTIYDYTSLIREFILHEKIDNPIIIAHSFGGRIATLLSAYYKEKIEKLILIDIAGIKPKQTLKSKLKKYLYKTLKRLTNMLPKKLRSKARNYLFKKFSSTDYYNLPENMRKTFQNIVNEDLKIYLKDIKQETLLIWGENDDATPIKDAYILRKQIKESELIILKGASHFSYLDYPSLVVNIIKEFIK